MGNSARFYYAYSYGFNSLQIVLRMKAGARPWHNSDGVQHGEPSPHPSPKGRGSHTRAEHSNGPPGFRTTLGATAHQSLRFIKLPMVYGNYSKHHR